MRFIGDFHIHSRYARACSKNIDFKKLEQYARMKGVDVLGTGDFQHPLWMKEIKAELSDRGEGILQSRTGFPFILQTEISLMYSQGGKGRRVHNLLLAPDLETADQIVEALGKRGRLDYDGRPIFGFSCIELVEMMMAVNKEIEIIPAHAWTPWFSIFGSNSGFNSIKECFQEKAKYIHAIETGLSSDPAMNWRLSQLDGIQLVSFSDMHSFWPHRMGREATLFDLKELTFKDILTALRTGEGLEGTIEVDPAYGKYHWDGHRNCGIVLSPAEAMKRNNVCPVCKRTLTIGVEHRVEDLADREAGHKPEGAKRFFSLLPLIEIMAFVNGGEVFSKGVMEDYHRLVGKFGNEFAILIDMTRGDLEKEMEKKLADAILLVRGGKARVTPGYDGVYGELAIEGMERPQRKQNVNPPEKEEKRTVRAQKSLTDF